jgi:hypothetical protein
MRKENQFRNYPNLRDRQQPKLSMIKRADRVNMNLRKTNNFHDYRMVGGKAKKSSKEGIFVA